MSREMKDSGIEWIGQIPEEWKCLSLIRVLAQPITDGPHETPEYIDDGIPFVSVDSLGEDENVDFNVVKKYISLSDYELYNKKTNIKPGDILFSKSATIGKTAIVGYEKFMVWSPLAIIKSNLDLIKNKYLYYILSSEKYIEHVRLLGTSNTQVNVGMKSLEKSKIVLPELTDQQNIIDFLDEKVYEINNIIAKTTLSIEEYKKYKQSIITEAVTKGLNLDVEMKESGIAWIGKIPNNCKISKIKYVTTKIGSGKTPLGGANVYSDDGIMFLRSQNIYNEYLSLDDVVYISKEIDETMKNTRVEQGDILFNITGASIGRSIIYPFEKKANVNQHVCIIRVNDKLVHNRYLHYVLISNIGLNAISIYQTGANREGINFEQIGNIEIPLMDIELQQQISDYLDKKCLKIDNLISQKQQLLTDIESYKKSLIYECVTGKKEI